MCMSKYVSIPLNLKIFKVFKTFWFQRCSNVSQFELNYILQFWDSRNLGSKVVMRNIFKFNDVCFGGKSWNNKKQKKTSCKSKMWYHVRLDEIDFLKNIK